MELNVSVCLSSVKGKKGKQQVQVYNNGVAVQQDAVNKQLQLLARSIDDVNAAVLHLAKTSVVKQPAQQCDNNIVERESICGDCYGDMFAPDEVVKVEINDFNEFKVVNQNLVLLDGRKFKVQKAYNEYGESTKFVKSAAFLKGFWKD